MPSPRQPLEQRRQGHQHFPETRSTTTGLHIADVHKLIDILNRLTDAGNTVVVIEHNLDVIKVADHIIDLGPEGGDGGGTLVFAGTPEDCAACEESYTGQFLKQLLKDAAREEPEWIRNGN